MELVILSGKGGTGKTTLAGSLASLAGYKILVDCDVDAANLHLVLGGEIKQRNSFSAGSKATIDESKCSACGTCDIYCRFDAIKNEEDANARFGMRWWIDSYACEGCGVCRDYCPDQAIDFGPVVSGEWYISQTLYGPLIHASLGIAEGNSGKLVSLLRTTAKTMARAESGTLILTDGPPGVGCPVIASVTGADYVLIVTEPSKSAIHDMTRIIKLVSNFKIPMGLCINKFDINNELAREIDSFASDNDIPVLAKIPFDPLMSKSLSSGKPFVELVDNETSRVIRSLWTKLGEQIDSGRIRIPNSANQLTKDNPKLRSD